MRRIIINIVLIILAFAAQSCIFPFIPFLSVSPNIILILVFSYGFMSGKKSGMLYGFIAGLLMDLFYSGPFGFFTMLFLWVGYVNGILSKFFYEDYITLPLIICTCNEIAYNAYIYIFRFAIRAKFDIPYYIHSILIPEIIITLLFTLLIYRPLLDYNKKLELIDKNW